MESCSICPSARAARGAGVSPLPPSVPAGGGPSRCERAGRRAGREAGRKERAAGERAERAEGASEGRQAVRSSFESNCLSQEEMWHSRPGEGRGYTFFSSTHETFIKTDHIFTYFLKTQ